MGIYAIGQWGVSNQVQLMFTSFFVFTNSCFLSLVLVSIFHSNRSPLRHVFRHIFGLAVEFVSKWHSLFIVEMIDGEKKKSNKHPNEFRVKGKRRTSSHSKFWGKWMNCKILSGYTWLSNLQFSVNECTVHYSSSMPPWLYALWVYAKNLCWMSQLFARQPANELLWWHFVFIPCTSLSFK